MRVRVRGAIRAPLSTVLVHADLRLLRVLATLFPLRHTALALVVIAQLFPSGAEAVINPTFTPADLVRSSSHISRLEVAAPRDRVATAQIVETLKGTALREKNLELDLSQASESDEQEVLAATAAGPAPAILMFPASPDEGANGKGIGALQIGTAWFAVSRDRGKWRLARDARNLFAVWAGDARTFAAATRYVLADPRADFPVRSDITWQSDLLLGHLPGKPSGLVVVDFGAPIGPCVLTLCEAGDRVYRSTSDGQAEDDVAALGLTTSSRFAAPGDFNGDGRLDLASWSGKGLYVATQTDASTFAVRPLQAKLPECVSFETLDVGAEAGAGLLGGTRSAPILLIPNGHGDFVSRPLGRAPAAESLRELGPGGVCTAADFDRDGHCDILQVFAGGCVFFAGEGPGRFREAVTTHVPVLGEPRTVLCGDYDADGRLDVLVSGQGGIALLRRADDGTWENDTGVTGELSYHANANQPNAVGAATCDINSDSRQGVAVFYPDRNPMVFFNRGFACFGLARELLLSDSQDGPMTTGAPDPFGVPEAKLEAAESLQQGQTAGTIADFDGDGVADLIGVDNQRRAWVLVGNPETTPVRSLSVACAAGVHGPLTVAVRGKTRELGVYVVRPGMPAFIGCAAAGLRTLSWTGTDGQTRTRNVVVVQQKTRVEIGP